MPGIIMENSGNTNHDRQPNGVTSERHPLPGKPKTRPEPHQNVTPTSPTAPKPNGLPFPLTGGGSIPQDIQAKLKQLPEEIEHLTNCYQPLSKLLERAAVKTYSQLGKKMQDLARMPMPIPKPAINGNATNVQEEDKDLANIQKKKQLLQFAEATHADWVKLLVITNWSRVADDLSKLIDLKVHIQKEKDLYNIIINQFSASRNALLGSAALPRPDLKTAVATLSTAKGTWFPELGFTPTPPLTPQDILKSLEDLNTILSMRLNIEEYDKIPLQFRDYSIASGRVTFRVAGEFEVDLTVVDEDASSQFWLIDFRFAFSPAIAEIPIHLRPVFDERINAALLKDGLTGCYKLLHEVVLTHKIGEFKKQAVELLRGKWINELKVEYLNRTLSIQYWAQKSTYQFGSKPAPKSWLLLGVHSGREKDKRPHPSHVSRLSLRWFREGVEVKDVEVPFSTTNISTESLLNTVVALHSSYLLTGIHAKLMERPLYGNRESSLVLRTSTNDHSKCSLSVQINQGYHVKMSIEPSSGRFFLSPASSRHIKSENHFNSRTRDPMNDAPLWIDSLRYAMIINHVTTHAQSVGWQRFEVAVKKNDLPPKMRDSTEAFIWLRRPEWKPHWCLTLSIGRNGESWWLMEAIQKDKAFTFTSLIQMPVTAKSPDMTYTYFAKLTESAAQLISLQSNLKELHMMKSNYVAENWLPSIRSSVPNILIRLSQLVPSKNKSPRRRKAWARDTVQLVFQGLESFPQPVISEPLSPGDSVQNVPKEKLMMVTTARMVVNVCDSLKVLHREVDENIVFNSKTGLFVFRLISETGASMIPALKQRIIQVERLVHSVEVLHRHKDTLQCKLISLERIVFTYGASTGSQNGADVAATQARGLFEATIDFAAPNNAMNVILEKGNPHLRIVDHLTHLLNGKSGLKGVAKMLPLTLPLLQGFDYIEDAWESVTTGSEAVVLVRSCDSYVIRYNLLSPTVDSAAEPKLHKIHIEVKIQNRKGKLYWQLQRAGVRESESDEIDVALQPLWDSSGNEWWGMRKGGVATAEGVKELLQKMDEMMKTIVLPSSSAPISEQVQVPQAQPAPAPQSKPSQPAPQARMKPQLPPQQFQQSQQRQQPQLNHNGQPMTQNRNNQVKREVVEID